MVCPTLSRNKKGSILDLFYIVIGVFVLAVIVVLVSFMTHTINTQISTLPLVGTEAQTASTTLSSTMPDTMNSGILFVFFGACIASIILASLVIVHPVFFIFYILETSLLVFFSGGIADAFQAFIETPALASEYSNFGVMIFMFRWLPIIIGIVSFILAIIMYKVRQNMVTGQ